MKRRSRTYITQMFPNFIIEDGFTEDDQLWHPGKDTGISRQMKRLLTPFCLPSTSELVRCHWEVRYSFPEFHWTELKVMPRCTAYSGSRL